MSNLTAVDEAIAAGALDQAIDNYSASARECPQDKTYHVLGALHLAKALMSQKPPNPEKAAELLREQHQTVQQVDLPPAIRNEWCWWELVVELAASEQLLVDELAFEQWCNVFLSGTQELSPCVEATGPLLQALEGLLPIAIAGPGSTTDRMERLLVELQCRLPQYGVVAPIQLCRVRLLRASRRYEEAIFEARILLSLCTQDPKAWVQAYQETEALLAEADLQENSAVWAQLQRFGSGGPDGRAGTSDDPQDTLAQYNRQYGPLLRYLPESAKSLLPGQPEICKDGVRLGYMLLLAGRPEAAFSCFSRLTQMSLLPADQEVAAVLRGLTAARALADGCLHHCIHPAIHVAADENTAVTWREGAIRLVDQHVQSLRELMARARPDVTIECCRCMANDSRLVDRLPTVLQLALDTCKAPVGSVGSPSAEGYERIDRGLALPNAQVHWTRLRAEQLYNDGQPVEALKRITSLPGMTPRQSPDPVLRLLQAGCLLRLGRSHEALQYAVSLPDCLEVTADVVARARLIAAAIHLQQGQSLTARQVLDRIVNESPQSEHAQRARAILGRL